MNLQKIALLTGLSVATVLGSGALSSAYALTFGDWRNTPIEFGNIRLTMDRNLTTNNTLLNNFVMSVPEIVDSGSQSPPNSKDYIFSFQKPSTDFLSPGTYQIYYKAESISTLPNGQIDLLTGINASSTGQNISVYADGWKNGYGSEFLNTTQYIGGNSEQIIFDGVNTGYIINQFTVNSGGRLSRFEISATLTAVPPEITAVPWETDALPLVGATMAFGAGVFAKRKIAQAKSKNLNFEPVKSECSSNVG
jgi:hypothetical protein